jgi:hypothetical protein
MAFEASGNVQRKLGEATTVMNVGLCESVKRGTWDTARIESTTNTFLGQVFSVLWQVRPGEQIAVDRQDESHCSKMSVVMH